jgi:hypothetical protein
MCLLASLDEQSASVLHGVFAFCSDTSVSADILSGMIDSAFDIVFMIYVSNNQERIFNVSCQARSFLEQYSTLYPDPGSALEP